MINPAKAPCTIYLEALKAVDLSVRIYHRVRVEKDILFLDEKGYDLSRFSDVILIGVGKASLQMGYALESLLGSRLSLGLLVTNRREPMQLRSEVIVSGHPVPDLNSL